VRSLIAFVVQFATFAPREKEREREREREEEEEKDEKVD